MVMKKITRVTIMFALLALASCSFLATLRMIVPSTEKVSSTAGNCDNGVCSLPSNQEAPVDSLSHKILSEWKDADGAELPPDAPQPKAEVPVTVPAVEEASPSIASVEPDKNNVKILTNMGYTEQEASEALIACSNDISASSEYLQKLDEEMDVRREMHRGLVAEGWEPRTAYVAIESCKGNLTAATEMLYEEEERVQANFNVAMKDMVANGWSERVAREALVAQWSYDQRKALGENVTEADAALQAIRPSLRKPNVTTASAESSTPASAAVNGKKDPKEAVKKSADADKALPPPAKKDDVVFEVTASNFQKLVLESPVPVLLDVYADWCGPCKQLGPILENAAIKAGGMFRLAKVNSDQEKAVAEALGVTGLPTVYTVSQGKLNDRFVGMLPSEQLQKYLVRAVTGFGERVQAQDVSEQDLQEAGAKICTLAGLASVSFRKKEQLYSLVGGALDLPGAYAEGVAASGLSVPVKTALAYIQNCRKDIRNAKFRTINTRSKAFVERIGGNAAALRLLDIAGFKATNTSATGAVATVAGDDGAAVLRMVHYNTAILTLLAQRVDELVNDRKFAKMKNLVYDMPTRANSGSRYSKGRVTGQGSRPSDKGAVGASEPPAAEVTTVAASSRLAVQGDGAKSASSASEESGLATVALRLAVDAAGSGGAASVRLPLGTTLRQAIAKVLSETPALQKEGAADYSRIEMRFPLPRRRLSSSAEELDRTLASLLGDEQEGARSLSLWYDNRHPGTTTDAPAGEKEISASHRSPQKSAQRQRRRGKMQTLFSSGILRQSRKKNNEYFGGDSTVVSAGEEEADDVDDADRAGDTGNSEGK